MNIVTKKVLSLLPPALACGLTLVSAQDPLTTFPESYALQFENEWVKVVRVHYEPYAKLGPHAHTAMASAYVYLNDGGPVIFKHIGTEYGPATRPPTKAGSFRIFRGLTEIHEVENTSPLPSDFLRVEFKTEPTGVRALRGRFFREPYPEGENLEKVQFENEQVRITRLVGVAGRTIDMATTETEPSLLIALTPVLLHVKDGRGSASELNLGLGQERWIAVNRTVRLENTGKEPAEMLRFDFRTPPVK